MKIAKTIAGILLVSTVATVQASIVDDFNNGVVTTISGESPATWISSGSGSATESGGKLHITANATTWQPWYHVRTAQRYSDLNFFKSAVTVSAHDIAIGGQSLAANRFAYFTLASISGEPTASTGLVDLQLRGNGNVTLGWGVVSSYHNPLMTGFSLNLGTDVSPITGFTLTLTPVTDSVSGLLKIAYAVTLEYSGTSTFDTNGDSLLTSADTGLSSLDGFISTTDTATLLARWKTDNGVTDINDLQSQFAIALQRKSSADESNLNVTLDIGSVSVGTAIPEAASLTMLLVPCAMLLMKKTPR